MVLLNHIWCGLWQQTAQVVLCCELYGCRKAAAGPRGASRSRRRGTGRAGAFDAGTCYLAWQRPRGCVYMYNKLRSPLSALMIVNCRLIVVIVVGVNSPEEMPAGCLNVRSCSYVYNFLHFNSFYVCS